MSEILIFLRKWNASYRVPLPQRLQLCGFRALGPLAGAWGSPHKSLKAVLFFNHRRAVCAYLPQEACYVRDSHFCEQRTSARCVLR